MKRIFCDTSFLFALRNVRDEHHEQARRVLEERLVEIYPAVHFVITDYIFDETVTILSRKAGKTVALETVRYLYGPDFKLEFIGEKLFMEALTVFTQYQDKRWSFTDCTSYVWIKHSSPDYVLATDQNFSEFGLPAPNLMKEVS